MLSALPCYDISLLYVEDEPATREKVSRVLEKLVSKLHVASNGQEGLELFRAHSPDMVLSDIRMPVMDGLEMVREIREIDPDCQVVILTELCDAGLLLDCIRLGISQFSIKPVNFAQLSNSFRVCNDAIQLKRNLKKQGDLIHLLSQAMEQAPATVVITDLGGTVEYVNTMFTRVTGYEASEVIGQNPRLLRSDITPPDVYQDLWRTIKAGNEWESELANRRKNGQIYWEWVKICPLRDSRGVVTKYLKVSQDITERKNYEENLHYISTHDPLTGLFNRSYFDSVLKRLAGSHDYPVSIVIADIDELKHVNDTCGHEEGDRVIRRAAESLMAVFRASDVVSRIGGDEFAILLPLTDEETARAIVRRISNVCNDTRQKIAEYEYGLSLGIATALEASALESMFKLADERMYLDKFEKKKPQQLQASHQAIFEEQS
jgi:two-component system cell cycle response regulator